MNNIRINTNISDSLENNYNIRYTNKLWKLEINDDNIKKINKNIKKIRIINSPITNIILFDHLNELYLINCCELYDIPYIKTLKYLYIKLCHELLEIPLEYKKTLKLLKINNCCELPDTNPNIYENEWFDTINNRQTIINKENKHIINTWFFYYKNNTKYKVYKVSDYVLDVDLFDNDMFEINANINNIEENAIDMSSDDIPLIEGLFINNCFNMQYILKNPNKILYKLYINDCHRIKEINISEIGILNISNCNNPCMIRCLDTINIIERLELENYRNLKILKLPNSVYNLELVNNTELNEIIYNKTINSIIIDNCHNIEEIPYINTITDITLFNQHFIVDIPLDYSTQLKNLKIQNCRWLYNSIHSNEITIYPNITQIKSWFISQEHRFTKKVRNIQKKYKRDKLEILYIDLFKHNLNTDVIRKIIKFII